jgi:hypothetical protein
MNARLGILGALLLVLIGAGAFLWYRNEHPAPFQNQPVATSTSGGVTNAASASLDESATYYEIRAAYPATTPLAALRDAGPNARAVDTLRRFEAEAIAQFKKDGNFDHLSHDDVQILGLDQRKESLDIQYKTYAGARTVSYVFSLTADTFGAHPNTTYRTFTFDTKTGALLDLGDLFVPNTQYLPLLSARAFSLLPAVIAKSVGIAPKDVDMTMLRAGIEPTPNNFSNWYIEGSNLVLVFPPYQVAAYAAGTQTLPLPLSSIQAISATYR